MCGIALSITTNNNDNTRATLIGAVSIVLWGTLALLTEMTGQQIPPFQLLALTFTIASITLTSKWVYIGGIPKQVFRVPATAWLLGVTGLFGYHFFYFIALANAPVVEAGLIAYLWPLLIVLFSSLLPGESITRWHIVGALISLLGCWILLGGGLNFDGFKYEFIMGYTAAAVCSLIWSGYSVLSRLVKRVSSDAVVGYCAVTAVLGWCAHFLFENSVWPENISQWLAVAGLGLGPVGIAFFTWDYGVKHGNIQLLGVLSYAAPLISTILLISLGDTPFSTSVAIACLAIVSGALIASRKPT